MSDYLVECGMLNLWCAGEDGGGPHPNVAKVAANRRKSSLLLMSAISQGELVYGHALTPGGDGKSRQEFVAFLAQLPDPIEITHHTAEIYGVLRARLSDEFPPLKGWRTNKKRRTEELYDPLAGRELGIDENDLWIASQAIELRMVLVTDDKMSRIKHAAEAAFGPKVFLYENWKTAAP